jgi:glycosyltransferase involved in cell wall biosynthesis
LTSPDVSVVIATRDRRDELARTLGRLAALPERPPVIVVDNGSGDGTAEEARRHPGVTVIRLRRNLRAAARTVGARRASTRYVAFSDDDSWWEPGALERACALLAATPGAGVVAGRTLVGPDGAEDPLNAVLAASPLPRVGLPGPRVLGFLGCAIVARRDAFLAAGGYRRVLGIGGEEELLALDLAARGWASVYDAGVVARHHPSPHRDSAARRAAEERNSVLIALLRYPPRRALAAAADLAGRAARRDPVARRALAGLVARLPRALAARRPLPPPVAAMAAALEPR